MDSNRYNGIRGRKTISLCHFHASSVIFVLIKCGFLAKRQRRVVEYSWIIGERMKQNYEFSWLIDSCFRCSWRRSEPATASRWCRNSRAAIWTSTRPDRTPYRTAMRCLEVGSGFRLQRRMSISRLFCVVFVSECAYQMNERACAWRCVFGLHVNHGFGDCDKD